MADKLSRNVGYGVLATNKRTGRVERLHSDYNAYNPLTDWLDLAACPILPSGDELIKNIQACKEYILSWTDSLPYLRCTYGSVYNGRRVRERETG